MANNQPQAQTEEEQNVSTALAHHRTKLFRELAAGGLSCAVASAMFNPMDVIKVRLQTQQQLSSSSSGSTNATEMMYRGSRHAVRRIVQEEGILGLWSPGLTASMLRELTYSSLRMGLYPVVKEVIGNITTRHHSHPQNQQHEDVGLVRKFAAGMLTGATGSAMANPTDLVKIRMQGEAGRVGSWADFVRLHPELAGPAATHFPSDHPHTSNSRIYLSGLRVGYPPSYRHTLHAFVSIFQHEGVAGLYKGVYATTARAALLTAGQLASYDHSKYLLKKHGILDEGVGLHIVGSLISGLCATTLAAPADLIKSRIMADRSASMEAAVMAAAVKSHHASSATHEPRYTGAFDCLVKTVRHEGPLALFKGWVPSYARLGPHFIISLPLLEQFRRMFGLGYMD